MSDYDRWLYLPYEEQGDWEAFCDEHEELAREMAYDWISQGKYSGDHIDDVIHFALELLYRNRNEKGEDHGSS